MDFRIVPAKLQDLDRICEIYGKARVFMAEHGNPNQWGDEYPKIDMLRQDIKDSNLYVVCLENTICGVFYLCQCDDPTYREIYNGAWHHAEDYVVIHRIAADGAGGIVKAAVDYALGKKPYIRIDTHEDNTVMQHVLRKIGFQYCGTIYVEDGTPRLAYDLKQ